MSDADREDLARRARALCFSCGLDGCTNTGCPLHSVQPEHARPSGSGVSAPWWRRPEEEWPQALAEAEGRRWRQ